MDDTHQEIEIMQTQINSKYRLQKVGSYLVSFGALTGLATLTFGLISCGGGGGGEATGGTSGSTMTISRISAIPAASGVTGIIAASAAQPLTIYGTNFVSGVSITVTNSAGGTYSITASAVPSTTRITANVTIPSVPTDSYVNVTVRTPTGNSVSSILGVAQNYKTIADVQTIFADNRCLECHGSDAAGSLSLSGSNVSATNLINADSKKCSQKLRVKAGDPRQENNVLIDVLKAKTTAAVMSCNTSTGLPDRRMPQGVASAVDATHINAITDWIALGAN